MKSFTFYGTNHRADAVFEVEENFRLAIEIKKGNSGSSIRSGLGQSIVYSANYDFVLYFFLDTTPNKSIANADRAPHENDLTENLWDDFNIRFIVL